MTAKQRAGIKKIALQLETLAIAFHDVADGIAPGGKHINQAIANTAKIVEMVREAFAQ